MYRRYLLAANRCRAQISSIAETGSLSERYCLLLEELRVEATRQTNPSQSRVTVMDDMTDRISASRQLGDAAPMTRFAGTNMLNEQNILFDNMPTEPFDYDGWDQFASILSSGLGHLDAFLSDDPFKF